MNADVLKTMGPKWPTNLYFLLRGLYFSFRGVINLLGKGKAGPQKKNGDSFGKT